MTFEQIRQYIKGVINGIDFNNHISPMPAEDMNEVVSPLPSVMSRRFKYSTEEQIVGEWIDGKPIYQKVFNITTPSSSGGASVLDVTSLSIDTCVDCNGFITNLGDNNLGNKPLNWYYDSTRYVAMWCSTTDHQIYVRANYSIEQNKSAILILQYTKTTD